MESSSNSELSSSWDVISDFVISSTDENVDDNQEKDTTEVNHQNINNSNQMPEEPLVSSERVEDLISDEQNCHDSSSDVDVIEENIDDVQNMHQSYSQIDDSQFESHTENQSEATEETSGGRPTAPRTWFHYTCSFLWSEMKEMLQRSLDNYVYPRPDMVKVLIALSVTFVAVNVCHLVPLKKDYERQKQYTDMQAQMKKRLQTLESENKELKNQVISKIQNDKIFGQLEEQISVLRNENSRLSNTMEELLQQLERQTNIFKSENQNRAKDIHDPYKKEIYKLKEQMNVLRIDNDDLQKQLVRMRYGSYPAHEGFKEGSSKKKHEKHGKKKHSEDEPAKLEIVTEEINDLKRKVFAELEKQKKWKETIDKLMGDLEKAQGEYPHTLDDDSQEKQKGKIKRKNLSNWSWKELKKNLKGSLENLSTINLSDLFAKYASVDKKKVEGVFDSINHYFQNAEEKASKILAGLNEEKNAFWKKLDGLKQKWHEMKDVYFNRPNDNSDISEESPIFTDNYIADPAGFRKVKMSHYKKSSEESRTSSEREAEGSNIDSQFKPPIDELFSDKPNNIISDEGIHETQSWLLDRAAQRSELRSEIEDGTENVNWFLKKHKESQNYDPDTPNDADDNDA